ncbi:6246_t:CDS:2, partial [Dentiscutata erythropus]
SSENIDLAYAGPNYLATFTKKIGGIQNLIVQNIANENEYVIMKAQKSTIIKLLSYLSQLYSDKYLFIERKLLLNLSTKIQKNIDHELTNTDDKNKKGIDEKRCILSVIAKNFSSKELYKNLQVDICSKTINGPGCLAIMKKPVVTKSSSNKNKTDHISATEMVKELENMIKDSELDAEIPTIKTVEGWIKTYSEKLHKLNANELLNNNTEDNSILQELSYNKETDKESNSILNNHSG